MKEKILETINFQTQNTMNSLKHGSKEAKVKAGLTLLGAGVAGLVGLFLVIKLFKFFLIAALIGGGYYYWKKNH